VLFHPAAREKILRGATTLADAVRVTLGPKSESVPIGKKWGTPLVCNDGITIYGFDASRSIHEAGIIDPTKVVRVALENAVSVASVLLLTRRR